jgi:hypothetical protein
MHGDAGLRTWAAAPVAGPTDLLILDLTDLNWKTVK